MRARLLLGSGVLLVFVVVALSVKAGATPTKTVVAVVVAICLYGLLLLLAGIFHTSSYASRQEDSWEARKNREHGHRAEGDPR